ncbi:MAG: NAD-dependent epimerase [Deltaproteobacteria bacterium HGW-Deltaproteobacteria-12]|jgi:UDP-glucose 4-epimerase|nr:MAG: NAD-dependent epimerase [Deltaproteobacteria bacterium HGW-Deltaproteobacteria-12]
MKITVFGGAGFLGSHVCDKLSDAGHDVFIYDIVPSPWLRSNQTMIVGDILDEESVYQATAGAGAVFNFAGIADIGDANVRPVDTVKHNILTNAIVLEACRLHSVGRYVFASSVYVYSKSGGFYRSSKQACEQYIENYHEAYGLKYTILRYGSLYGPRADGKNAIYRFVKEAMETGSITYYGTPDALREYIHVEDAALSSVEVLKDLYANQNIVLTGSQPMTVRNVFNMIAEMLGKKVEFVFKNDFSNTHYMITPYSFSPRLGRKMIPPVQIDLGQGVLHIIEAIHHEMNPELQNFSGLLVKDQP